MKRSAASSGVDSLLPGNQLPARLATSKLPKSGVTAGHRGTTLGWLWIVLSPSSCHASRSSAP